VFDLCQISLDLLLLALLIALFFFRIAAATAFVAAITWVVAHVCPPGYT
jgi:hypothetical protein